MDKGTVTWDVQVLFTESDHRKEGRVCVYIVSVTYISGGLL